MTPEPFQPGLARLCAERVEVEARSRHAAGSQRRRARCALRLRFRGGEEIGIDEIVALYGLAGKYGEGTREDWAGESEGVELAALAAGVDAGGQVGE